MSKIVCGSCDEGKAHIYAWVQSNAIAEPHELHAPELSAFRLHP
jgi:hypothetical protein